MITTCSTLQNVFCSNTESHEAELSGNSHGMQSGISTEKLSEGSWSSFHFKNVESDESSGITYCPEKD